MDPSQPNVSYWLVGIRGNERRVRLSAEGPLLVGRGAHNHLVLNDYRISRQHSRVAHERDGFVVYDLNSANGTFVNGVAVRRQQIHPNDEISFGPHAFKVEIQAEAAAPNAGGVAFPTKWRPTESITKFHQVHTVGPGPSTRHDPSTATNVARDAYGGDTYDLADGEGGEAAGMLARSAHDTIPPDGADIYDVHIPSSARESSKYRAEVATVDLNQLEDAYEKLNTLYAFMQAISKTIDRRELLELIARKILGIYPAARSVGIYLRAARDPNVVEDRFVLIHFAGDRDSPALPILPNSIATAVVRAKRAVFDGHASKTATWGSTMYAPMIDREDTLGIIYVSAGEGSLREFTSSDLELLNGVAVPAAITMVNTRMHEESLQRERLNRDLELAAQIQKSFLPREVLSVPGLECLATYKAAYTVGGDFYDVFWVGPDQLAVFVGDISGKGIAAALLMARISGELRVAALAHIDPVSVLTIMNKSVMNRNQPEEFFTAIYFTLDVKTGEVWLATAGQPSPYLVRKDGSILEITDGASGAVGMLEDVQFTSTRLFLDDGDSLVLYTDGVVEAAAPDGTLFGNDRLAVALRGSTATPKDISERILESVGRHTKTAPANDDMTIFVCHRAEGAPASMQPRRNTAGAMAAVPDPPRTDRLTARR